MQVHTPRFEYVTRHDSLLKTILQGTVEGGRRPGQQRYAGWTTSKSGHHSPCQSCSHGPPAEKTGRGSLLNRSSSLPDDPIGQGTEVNTRQKRGVSKIRAVLFLLNCAKCSPQPSLVIVVYLQKQDWTANSVGSSSLRQRPFTQPNQQAITVRTFSHVYD